MHAIPGRGPYMITINIRKLPMLFISQNGNSLSWLLSTDYIS